MSASDTGEFRALAHLRQDHRRAVVAVGLGMMGLAVAAAAFPAETTLAVGAASGWLLWLAGALMFGVALVLFNGRLRILGAAAALVKGGHLRGASATDVVAFADGSTRELSAPRLPIRSKLHGGGCTLASLIAGRLAAGHALTRALPWAKRTLHRALGRLVDVGPGPLAVIVP